MKLNIICIQNKLQTKAIRIQGIILRLLSSSFCKILFQNKASVTIVRDISTVPYHNIADQMIRQIHRPIRVVIEVAIKILSFLMIA